LGIALVLFPLLSGRRACLMAGLCWALTAAGRMVSIVADKAGDARNWGAVLFEALFAASLPAGAPTAQHLALAASFGSG
jgi:hypothetical protein